MTFNFGRPAAVVWQMAGGQARLDIFLRTVEGRLLHTWSPVTAEETVPTFSFPTA